MDARRTDGFHAGTELDVARERLSTIVTPHGRVEELPVARTDGRVVARPVEAAVDAPRYARAALDGFAIRAADAEGATEDDPARLDRETGAVAPGGAVRVHTGSEIPEGADAVVRVERTRERDGGVEVLRDVDPGKNVAPAGEDVRAAEPLYDPGHRLRPSDLGLLKSAGVQSVPVAERPRVTVLPTGEELVESDPDPGEVVETNGLTVSRIVERWGGKPARREVVSDDEDELADAIREELDADLLVTIGGTSVGRRDVVPEVVESLGDLLVHGVSIKPGHPVGLGTVEGTPVLLLPGYPVSCIVNAVQFLRPAVCWSVGTRPKPLPTVSATLAEPIESEAGVRRFTRVRLRPAETGGGRTSSGGEVGSGRGEDRADETPRTLWTNPEGPTGGGDDGPGAFVATPTPESGAGVLSSVALADGWVVVPEDRERIRADTEVDVQDWEWHP